MLPSGTQLPPPSSVAASIGPGQNYFGGRMTETRLKEVGRMTKETIQHLHKYKEIFCYCLLYTSPSPRDATLSRMPSSA